MLRTIFAIAVAGLIFATVSGTAQAVPAAPLPAAVTADLSNLTDAQWRRCWRDRWGAPTLPPLLARRLGSRTLLVISFLDGNLKRHDADVRFGSEADMCNAPTHVRFAPKATEIADIASWRMVLWLSTEEVDHAKKCDPAIAHFHRRPLEQGQTNWSQAAPPAEACLGNSRHAPKWAE